MAFILSSTPDPVLTRECFEAAMVAAVFDQQVSILLRAEAVICLTSTGSPGSIPQVHELITQFGDYGIDQLFVCSDALRTFDLELEALKLGFQVLDRPSQVALIASQDAVLPG